MITPNLATRPFLNTRPVWLVTAAAGLAALILIALNLHLFLVANRSLEDEMARRDALLEQHDILETEVRKDIGALERVPWRTLTRRVQATNLILREHAFSWLGMLDDIERVMPYDVRVPVAAKCWSRPGCENLFQRSQSIKHCFHHLSWDLGFQHDSTRHSDPESTIQQ